jgi:flagellar basal-body rod protein FlgC
MFGALDTSVSGMIAQRTRMAVLAANIANKDTILDADGNYSPFQRRMAIFAPGDPSTGSDQGVHVREIRLDDAPFMQRFEPGSPFADESGYVRYPNIDSTNETINAMAASRSYEANIAVAEATKSMIQSSLRLLA